MEEAVLPLAHGPVPRELLLADVGLADNGLEGVALEVSGDLGPIHLADALRRLLYDLQEGVVHRAAPVVGVDARHFLVPLVIATDGGTVLNAAGAQDILR